MAECPHLLRVPTSDGVLGVPPSADGCQDCLPERTDWVHLRRCLECGRILCCNSSPMRHAQAHAETHEHPLVQSFEPGEDWVWCYVDEALLRPQAATASPSYGGRRE